MLDVFFTVDVEIWCDGWSDIDAKFPRAFDAYIQGVTPQGDYGIPFQGRVLAEHGLTGVFFVEPLFSARFGAAPLQQIVGMLNEHGQEVQLHLHTEWVDEAREPLLPDVGSKRQFLRQFSRAEQRRLLEDGCARLARAGAQGVNAFRAGSFGFNADTLHALRDIGMPFDSSYNAVLMGPSSGVAPGRPLFDVHHEPEVTEYPMTVFDDGLRGLRHLQLGACSSREIETVLWQAAGSGQRAVVMLSHGFELLSPSKRRVDPIVLRRFERLCAFLDRHRGTFRTRGFHDLVPPPPRAQPAPVRGRVWQALERTAQQLWRKRFR